MLQGHRLSFPFSTVLTEEDQQTDKTPAFKEVLGLPGDQLIKCI